MVSLLGFNADNVKPATGRPDALPAGDYAMVIADSKQKENKAKTGWFLELTLQVVDGPCKGRKVWDRLNLKNQSPAAVQIAEATLSAICHAIGIKQPQDSSQLHGKPLLVQVKCREYQGDMTNEVVCYKSLSELKAASNGGNKDGNSSNSSQEAPPLPSVQDMESAPWQ